MSDEILGKIEAKLDRIAEDVNELKITAVKHDINLEAHMEQSITLKKLYDHLDENKIQPLQKDMNKLKGGYQLLVVLGIIASIAIAFIEFFKK